MGIRRHWCQSSSGELWPSRDRHGTLYGETTSCSFALSRDSVRVTKDPHKSTNAIKSCSPRPMIASSVMLLSTRDAFRSNVASTSSSRSSSVVRGMLFDELTHEPLLARKQNQCWCVRLKWYPSTVTCTSAIANGNLWQNELEMSQKEWLPTSTLPLDLGPKT